MLKAERCLLYRMMSSPITLGINQASRGILPEEIPQVQRNLHSFWTSAKQVDKVKRGIRKTLQLGLDRRSALSYSGYVGFEAVGASPSNNSGVGLVGCLVSQDWRIKGGRDNGIGADACIIVRRRKKRKKRDRARRDVAKLCPFEAYRVWCHLLEILASTGVLIQ